MKFGVFYEHQLPRPWREGDEQRLFQDALGVSREAEDAFWTAFAARIRRDEQAWISFREIMLRQRAQVQEAVRWSGRSGFGLLDAVAWQ